MTQCCLGSESRQAGHSSRTGVVIARRSYEVALEERNAAGRDFNDLSEVGRNQFVEPRISHRGVLQNVDGSVVGVVRKHVAERERMNNSGKILTRFVERTNGTTGQTLDSVTNVRQRQVWSIGYPFDDWWILCRDARHTHTTTTTIPHFSGVVKSGQRRS